MATKPQNRQTRRAATRPNRSNTRQSGPVYRTDAIERVVGRKFTVTETRRDGFSIGLSADTLRANRDNDWAKLNLVVSAMKACKKAGYPVDPAKQFKLQNFRNGAYSAWVHFYINRPTAESTGAGGLSSADLERAERKAQTQERKNFSILMNLQASGVGDEVLRRTAKTMGIDWDKFLAGELDEATPAETSDQDESDLESEEQEGDAIEDEGGDDEFGLGEDDDQEAGGDDQGEEDEDIPA